jgi:hypothetical protein
MAHSISEGAAGKKPRRGAQKGQDAPTNKKASAKATVAPKAPKGEAAVLTKKTRDGSKAAQVLALLRQADGATLEDLISATGWQAHSVRGFLSGVITKKMGLNLVSEKADGSARRYRLS